MRELRQNTIQPGSIPVNPGITMKNRLCEAIIAAIADSIGISQDDVTAHLEALEWDLLAYLDLIVQWEDERPARLITYVRKKGFSRFNPE